MPKFRKKPVQIEAVQFVLPAWTDKKDWPDWLHSAYNKPPTELGAISVAPQGGRTLNVMTLEGGLTAQEGDWIIRGVKGELYPCKPDIFAATYDLA